MLPRFNSVLFFDHTSRDEIYLATDACNHGLGGYHVTSQASPQIENAFARVIPHRHRAKHINVKEMLAIKYAFKRWGKSWKHSHVTIAIDNTACQSGIS
jgi:hypothetical protein